MGGIHPEQTVDLHRVERYQEALRQIPSPGCGCGFHTYCLGIANRGVKAGIPPQQIFDDIRQNTPPGKRRIPNREIWDAVRKAVADNNCGTFTPKPKPAPVVQDGKAALQRIIEQSEISDEGDLWELSPIRLMEAV